MKLNKSRTSMFHARDTLLAESIMKFTTGNDGSGADNCQRSPIASRRRNFQDCCSLHKCELC
ncbi:hypothetical protein T05_16421 [Trichinella murrelli]|uniref:Uncharacterized protein n=2 Tax=Trichinella TaxID=6333 RepID=A0A0V0U050_9BILA|nr:hypothetical protein T05_16421 [Trichinella murrelli]